MAKKKTKPELIVHPLPVADESDAAYLRRCQGLAHRLKTSGITGLGGISIRWRTEKYWIHVDSAGERAAVHKLLAEMRGQKGGSDGNGD